MADPKVRIPEPAQPRSALNVEPAVADMIRRVHRAEQRALGDAGDARTLSTVVHAMAIAYIEKTHPDWIDEQREETGA